MTIYEQIQKALDSIETGLADQRTRGDVAREAAMSERSFQHYFWAVTGMTYQDYLVGRRLTEGARRLSGSDQSILRVALECGYQSHQAFTRAFRGRFGVTPQQYRQGRPRLNLVERIQTYQERFMGVILKELPQQRCAVFDGYAPEPENKAHRALDAWKANRPGRRPSRTFGHNLNAEGKMACTPDYAGYRLLVSLDPEEDPRGAAVMTIARGRFAVTGIEGSVHDGSEGRWIGEGWARLNAMAAEKNLRIKEGARWFEEELEPAEPGNLRLDLYLEVEG